MKLKSTFAKPFAAVVNRQLKKEMANALRDQKNIFEELIKVGRKTEFGQEHDFDGIKTYEDFKARVPIRDYEQLKPYIEKIKQGKHNILWKGKPIYFAKTSGTTSGTKYIPITKDSISNHINTARNALLHYMADTGKTEFADGKMIFLSGSPEMERVADIPTGRLSGIVNHHVPAYLRRNQLPKYETNCIEDWETKLDKIVDETINEDMRLISGIPPWIQMYFDKLEERSGKKVGELFPNFNLMVQGGVNFEPYKKKLFESIGRKVDTVELFPASEGFFAFQDKVDEKGLWLNTNSGIFYEFVPVDELDKKDPKRIGLGEVEVGKNYALIISSNAGLWAYNIGDTVKFLSKEPYKLIVSGRTKHYISAFGEHVIVEEVEKALQQAADEHAAVVTDFTVAPVVSQDAGKSYHEWFIEFEKEPEDKAAFRQSLENNVRQLNVYYDDLIKGNILQPLKINSLKRAGFIEYMKSIGKLGGQNKVPKLSNGRQIADALNQFVSLKNYGG